MYVFHFFIFRMHATHFSHHLALLAHPHNYLYIFYHVMPKASSTNFSQGPLFSKMPQIFMHLDYKCHSFLCFGHKQSLEVEPLILPVIIDYPLSSPLAFFKIHCVWSYAFSQQPHASCVLPNVNVFLCPSHIFPFHQNLYDPTRGLQT